VRAEFGKAVSSRSYFSIVVDFAGSLQALAEGAPELAVLIWS
jgi:hypothetical protein